jgi:hypothetical protein
MLALVVADLGDRKLPTADLEATARRMAIRHSGAVDPPAFTSLDQDPELQAVVRDRFLVGYR